MKKAVIRSEDWGTGSGAREDLHDMLPSAPRHPALLLGLALACTALVLALPLRSRILQEGDRPFSVSEPPPTSGILRVSLLGELTRTSEPPLRHETTWVNGPAYGGMEDNDLRGFLDGRYKYSWNQTTQVHVRAGRRGSAPRYGEHEIYRTSQRWSGIDLPPGARVLDAKLAISVISAPQDTLRLMLYEVKHDWNPGAGGVLENNVSPPKPGEVWWVDRSYAEAPWGLPGIGFASDLDPDADTGAMPLADALYVPGQDWLEFTSDRLAHYAQRRVEHGEPLLFLIKLSDPLEDTPGSKMLFHSGNADDTRSPQRRPKLTLEWEPGGEIDHREGRLLLERGRTLRRPAWDATDADALVATFLPDPDAIAPSLEVRIDGGPWRAMDGIAWLSRPDLEPTAPVAIQVGPTGRKDTQREVELRVISALHPVVLGEAFRSRLTNTWIRTGPPEEQRVPWRFVSPTGVVHEPLARYVGKWTWEIVFVPHELGPWSYSWEQDFGEDHFQSPTSVFDVIGGSLDRVRLALRTQTEELGAIQDPGPAQLAREMDRFARLERAAMLENTPELFASAVGESLREELRTVREILGDRVVPDSIPMVADKPPRWQRTP